MPYLRPEIGFTPKWFNKTLGIDFGEKWHTDPHIRKKKTVIMLDEIDKQFPGINIGSRDDKRGTLDLLIGLFGTYTIASMFGVPIRYDSEQ